MIFYLAADQEGYRHLLTRKDEAAKMDPDFKTLDIEPNKEAMQTALQELLTAADEALRALAQASITVETKPAAPTPTIPMAPTEKDAVYPEKKKKTDEIIDWILDEASVHHVEQILSALGCRIGEIAAKDQGKPL